MCNDLVYWSFIFEYLTNVDLKFDHISLLDGFKMYLTMRSSKFLGKTNHVIFNLYKNFKNGKKILESKKISTCPIENKFLTSLKEFYFYFSSF